MPTALWIKCCRFLCFGRKRWLILVFALAVTGTAGAEVITQLPTRDKVVALTFDACETRTPSYFDRKILDYLVEHKIPCTIFVSGKFAQRNQEELRKIAQLDFVEIENHSLTHPQHMERLSPGKIEQEVVQNAQLLQTITHYQPVFFRFPAGNYDRKTLHLVESLGYQVVHWTFPSGDPDKKISAPRLSSWVMARTRPGNILIFHINGRGYQTGEALPVIVQDLTQKGYRFVKLRDILGKAPANHSAQSPTLRN
jgi:peptidoglycan-N-acetylglucosamine deacetylase